MAVESYLSVRSETRTEQRHNLARRDGPMHNSLRSRSSSPPDQRLGLRRIRRTMKDDSSTASKSEPCSCVI
jgi:hypothetical protein